MRNLIILGCLAAFCLAPRMASGEMPPPPTPLTPAQFNHLVELETHPDHANVLGVRATFKSEREQEMEWTRLGNDVSTAAYNTAFWGLVATFLLVGL